MGSSCSSARLVSEPEPPEEQRKEKREKKKEKRSKETLSVRSFVFSYVLGKGGFGSVTAGLHIDSGNWYAVKEINLNFKSKRKYTKHVQMISNEIEALDMCESHPYICNLYHTFKGQTSIFLVLDMYIGGDLRYHIKKGAVFPEQTTAFLVTCMASALQFLHKKCILHRDIKPDNIMFDEHGFPSLTDFGICFLYEHLPKEQRICSMNSGTRQYVAPEVLTSTHWHDTSSDYWSLGVLAYELIYGERPFEDGCPEDFIVFNECLQHMTKKYDDHSFELQMKCSMEPPLKKTAALKFLLPSRPFIIMPRISIPSQSDVSAGCRGVLRGLLDAHPSKRLSYEALSKQEWFLSQGCVWEKIIHCEVVPPFVPNIMEVAQDVLNNQAKNYTDENSVRNKSSFVPDMMQISRPRNKRKKRGGNQIGVYRRGCDLENISLELI